MENRIYLSAIVSGTVKENVNAQRANRIVISEQRNAEKYDFSALGIGE